MLQAGRNFITSHPIMIIAPATLISITILIFNLTGDAVEFDAFENKNLNISDSNNYKLVQNVDLNIYQGKLNVIIGESGQ